MTRAETSWGLDRPGIPVRILTLHRIVDEISLPHDLARRDFDSLAKTIDAAHTVSTDISAPRFQGEVTFTFDDATSDHMWAAEVLAQLSLRGVFFVPTARVGKPGQLRWRELQELVAMGHVIGSHSVTHQPLDRIPLRQVQFELETSKSELEDRLGVSVSYFAPPGGHTVRGLDERMILAGYEACRLTRWGLYRRPGQKLRIPSVPVTSYTYSKGWIFKALSEDFLPPPMVAAGFGRRLLPEAIRARVRSRLHPPNVKGEPR
jgi:peptidoglycan/xylan/chitin deacetylase (PgdA/CDA1 family)